MKVSIKQNQKGQWVVSRVLGFRIVLPRSAVPPTRALVAQAISDEIENDWQTPKWSGGERAEPKRSPKTRATKRPAKQSAGANSASRINTDDDRSYKTEVLRRVFPGLDSQRVKSKLRSSSDPWGAVNGAVSDAISSGRLHRSDKSLSIGVLQEMAM